MLAEGGPETFAALVSLGVAGDVTAIVIVVIGELRARRRPVGRPKHRALIAGALVLLGSAGSFFLAGALGGAICITRGCVTSANGSWLPLIGFTVSAASLVAFLIAGRGREGRSPAPFR